MALKTLSYLALSFFSPHRQEPLMCRERDHDDLLECPVLPRLLEFDLYMTQNAPMRGDRSDLKTRLYSSPSGLLCMRVPYAWKKV